MGLQFSCLISGGTGMLSRFLYSLSNTWTSSLQRCGTFANSGLNDGITSRCVIEKLLWVEIRCHFPKNHHKDQIALIFSHNFIKYSASVPHVIYHFNIILPSSVWLASWLGSNFAMSALSVNSVRQKYWSSIVESGDMEINKIYCGSLPLKQKVEISAYW